MITCDTQRYIVYHDLLKYKYALKLDNDKKITATFQVECY